MRQGTYSVYSSKTCSPWRNFRYHQVPISFSHPPIQWLRINIIYTQQQKSSTNQFPHLFCFFWAFFPKQLRYFFRVSTKSFLPPLKRRSFDVGLQDYLSRYAVDDMGCDALRRCTPEVQEAATWSVRDDPKRGSVKLLLGCWWELRASSC